MISVFDLFTIGIGPSSSHTVGPMRGAAMFVDGLGRDDMLARVTGVKAEMFGSLGATGHGHGTPKAVLLGLEGERPEMVDPDAVEDRVERIGQTGRLRLAGEPRSRPSRRLGWRCAATGSTMSRSTRSSRPCARRAPT